MKAFAQYCIVLSLVRNTLFSHVLRKKLKETLYVSTFEWFTSTYLASWAIYLLYRIKLSQEELLSEGQSRQWKPHIWLRLEESTKSLHLDLLNLLLISDDHLLWEIYSVVQF